MIKTSYICVIRTLKFISHVKLIMSKHVIKSIPKFISNLLDLELFSVNFILNVINSLVKLGDVHFSILKSTLSNLVLILDAKNFVLQFLLSLNSLLSTHLKLLHVLSNHLKFLFNFLKFLLCKLGSVNGSLELLLLHAQFSVQLIKLLFVVTGHLYGLSQVLVKLLKGNFIVHAFALNNLDLLETNHKASVRCH